MIQSSTASPASRSRRFPLAGFAALIPLILVLASCETLRVGSDYDHTATFAGYHTFTWIPREEHGTGNPLIAERAREAIRSALERKGYTFVSAAEQADFAVDFTIGAHDRVDIHTYPAPYAGSWWWYGRGWWGYPYWGRGVDLHRYREGVLAIDIFDAKTHRPVWHGWARKPLGAQDLAHARGMIREAVDEVLARFPPG